MRFTRPLVLAASATVLAATLTACSQDGGDGGLSWEDSPLNEYMSAAWGGDMSPEEQQREMDEQTRLVEEAVAACMQEQGFEYTPNVSGGGVVISSDDEEWNPDDREWVAQYGYGAVNWPGRDAQMEEPIDEEEYVDANADYVESLSPSEQEAYSETLNGPMPPEEAMEDPDFDWESWDMGCYGDASDEVYGADAELYESDEFAPLMDAMEQLYTDMENDPEFAEIDAAWSSCMADAGHAGFTTRDEAQTSIYDEIDAFWNDFDYEGAGEDASPEDDPAYQEIGEREIELALADLDCREESDYDETRLKVQFDLEEQFIADHEAELEAFRDAAVAQGS
ncbi:hypothetical protein [Microbacterium karelineae]|uniref:hypothetical protein n=1 Tax=Microbacterium karelineae TaxID=2654283 RepID=UPI0012EA005A|nr:hypothetical protein [Microbacterium karelineae]